MNTNHRQAGGRSAVGGLIVAVAVLWMGAVSDGVGAQSSAIGISPSSFALDEGRSRLVEITLDEPIIAPGAEPGIVTLELTSEDPDRVELSVSSVTWEQDEWFAPREVEVFATADGVSSPADVTISGEVTSNSAYYNGRTVSIQVTINDLDPVATSTSTTSAAGPGGTPAGSAPSAAARVAGPEEVRELALTGGETSPALLGSGLVLLGVGAALIAGRRSSLP